MNWDFKEIWNLETSWLPVYIHMYMVYACYSFLLHRVAKPSSQVDHVSTMLKMTKDPIRDDKSTYINTCAYHSYITFSTPTEVHTVWFWRKPMGKLTVSNSVGSNEEWCNRANTGILLPPFEFVKNVCTTSNFIWLALVTSLVHEKMHAACRCILAKNYFTMSSNDLHNA
jgi:hypothetical protein